MHIVFYFEVLAFGVDGFEGFILPGGISLPLSLI
jgi:hypothetical protein